MNDAKRGILIEEDRMCCSTTNRFVQILLLLVAGSAVFDVIAAKAARAGEVTHVVSGAWQSSDFHDPANPGCSIGGDGSVVGGRLIMGASQRVASPMSLVIRKPSWTIPKGMSLQVSASFPDGQVIVLSGIGDGKAISVNMPPDSLSLWVHELTASSVMRLTFAGNESPWTFELGGTSKVIAAMYRCFADHGITGVDAPFTPAPDRSAFPETRP